MEDLKKALIACGALKFGEFILTSGKKSDYYIDIKYALTKPSVLNMILDKLAMFVSDADRLAGTELGAVPLVTGLALRANKPYLIIRKQPREHGVGGVLIGDLNAGEKVVVVEDVATTGSTILRAVEIIKSYNATVTKVLAVVDRGEGAANALRNLNLQYISLLTASDLLSK